MSSFERPKTAQEAVLAEIRQQLLDGRLAPGESIRPDALGEELGVSAVPVREALRILEGEGHVHYRPHRGYVVATLDMDDLIDIYRIRELLETEAVSRAIPRLGADTVVRLREIVHEMDEVQEDVISLTAVNRRFHFTIFEAAEMPQLEQVLRILWDSSDRYRVRYLMSPENRRLVHDQHHRMMQAIAARDVDTFLDESHMHRAHAIAALAEAIAVAGNEAAQQSA
ncbi:MAG: GntR family transcriptional regulator [Acidimicrobiaceae bacterium]|nr:GntR family transcriptional regulator [Acidimicrobiaceae bacterium]MCY3644236.1 GntR family transcriptional regulator [Acidimicrobiaceae bacterium]MDE0664358.1 GntR family transcriptional regulator [Acidimicrobiaceae bacterium]MXY09175.1 GntR family transcriptional regulator [Acidimicrobiaceae bacterium]MXZ66251.1 GntR family transcriptional regulator [Acidimicrobiaceae bacterium]